MIAADAQYELPRWAKYYLDEGGLTIEMRSPTTAAWMMVPPMLVFMAIWGLLTLARFGYLGAPLEFLRSPAVWAFAPVAIFSVASCTVGVLFTGPLATHVMRLERGLLMANSKLGPFSMAITKRDPSPGDVRVVHVFTGPHIRVRAAEMGGVEYPELGCFFLAWFSESQAKAIAQLMTDYLEGESGSTPAPGVQ